MRLSAFLVLMKCPSRPLVEKVKSVFEKEQINQVRSFVSAFIDEIRTSNDPEKANLRQIIKSQFFDPKAQKDPRRFSSYVEHGSFSQETNYGILADQVTIFVPDSPLPVLLSLNVTLDLFGNAVNVFEIGGSVKGFDRVLESLLGHHGYFSDPEGYYLKPGAPQTHPNPSIARMTALVPVVCSKVNFFRTAV
ncbi:unnamed protein product [Soboliphyme baturini]|uniref:DUF1943 domain-containing protein n=1 Tax=Soboliphyme baturini TaxID=241478 RepID=A0A183JAJ5_9BILA|nr:unnamed protein product [Soboliphyme baturini]